MIELNFSNIRTFDGSKDGGFEELICQLAHLSPPANADYFVRKEGAGGDAGVECFWKLKDGSEYAWQAKYFLDSINDSQWSQINDSVLTALNKHPLIKKYYICVPQDLPDSRKKGRGGKAVTSARDKWNSYCEAWQQEAIRKGKSVKFHFWGKHEIGLLLSQRENSKFNGRARYWFNELILTTEIFNNLIEKSKITLGERFTPEYHVDLPINKIFEGLGLTAEYKKNILIKIHEWIDLTKGLKGVIDDLIIVDLKYKKFSDNLVVIKKLSELFQIGVIKDNFFSNIQIYLFNLRKVIEFLYSLRRVYYNERDKKDSNFRSFVIHEIDKNLSATTSLDELLSSISTQAACVRQLLLEGEPGIGKSHLLCDIAISREQKNYPTVFVLGQHYQGGNPLDFLKRELDLVSVDDNTFLGALDACGEANKSNVLILIDAINEGKYNAEWRDWLVGLFHQIKQYSYLSIAISCRSTYVSYLIPDELKTRIVTQQHEGFRGYEHRAATIYLNKQGIVKPSAPILAPELTNPLFLKTCCKAIKQAGLTSFPKGLRGLVKVFEFYIQSTQQKISIAKSYRPHETIIKNALYGLAEELFPDYIYGLEYTTAFDLISSKDTRPNIGEPLYDLMLHEGILAEDVTYNHNSDTTSQPMPVVRFTYERFSDYLIANNLTKDITLQDLDTVFIKNKKFQTFLTKNRLKYIGILSGLNVIVAEKFNVELIDYFPKGVINNYIFEEVFVKTLTSRNPNSFTQRTLELFNEIPKYCYEDKRIDILLALSTEPGHPWNAERTNNWLKSFTVAERDACWSIYIARADTNEEDHEYESNLRSLLEWAMGTEVALAEPERIYLCTIILIWVTSTTNRKVRDEATKAVAHLLCYIPDSIISILSNFYDVNDPYIMERLYAATYGTLTNIDDVNCLTHVAEWIYGHHFKNKALYPHILLRDYLLSILLYVKYKEGLPEYIDEKTFLPPYRKNWELKDPINVSDIPSNEQNSIYRSVMGSMSDFSHYSMRSIRQITSTELNAEELRTGLYEKLKFANELESHLGNELHSIILREEKKRILKKLKESEIWKTLDLHEILDKINEENKELLLDPEVKEISIKDARRTWNQEKIKTDFELFVEKYKEAFTSEQRLKLKWLARLNSESTALQSKSRAQRWIYHRAMELGWTNDLFENFERNLRHESRQRPTIERVGKKYQWIAYHEYLAHLIDSFQFKSFYSSHDSVSEFFLGAWQFDERDIDPTLFLCKTHDDGWLVSDKKTWWQPIEACFSQSDKLNDLQDWLWNEDNLPRLSQVLTVVDESCREWLVLDGFVKFKKSPTLDKDKIPYQDVWYRINPVIIADEDFTHFKSAVVGQELCNPDLIQKVKIGYQSCLGESFWHPCIESQLDELFEEGFNCRLNDVEDIDAFCPVASYEHEGGTDDASVLHSINFRLPSPQLVENLNLKRKALTVNEWVDSTGNLVFYDPSLYAEGPSFALCRKDILGKWLQDNGYRLIWLIGGEKQLFTESTHHFYGRLNFNAFFSLKDDGIEGEVWSTKLEPEDER